MAAPKDAPRVVGRTTSSTLKTLQPPPPAPKRTTARVVKHATREPEPTPEATEPQDLVRVRATQRGQYGLGIDINIRNPGEVFWMATSAMRPYPLPEGEPEANPERDIIETPKGQFELPSWVVLVGDDERVNPEDEITHGHKTAHGMRDGEVL